MSSRKSSSRASSRSSSRASATRDHDDNKNTFITDPKNKPSSISIITTTLFTILYHLLVLGYIITLEGQKCDCIRDWRHDFIKYYSASMIVYGLIIIVLTGTSYRNHIVLMILQNVLLLLSVINILCIYTYVGDLDKTFCKCAIEKQKNMHFFLYIWRYILVGTLIFSLIMIIIGALSS
jgi:hypothetical protein